MILCNLSLNDPNKLLTRTVLRLYALIVLQGSANIAITLVPVMLLIIVLNVYSRQNRGSQVL